MPSQMVTTFGLYATAPTQIVRVIVPRDSFSEMLQKSARSCCGLVLKERHSQKRFGDELAQHVASWRHNRARVRIAEQAFDTHVPRERRTATNAHGCRGDADGDVTRGRFGFEHAQHCRLAGTLKMLDQIVDTR